MEDRFSIDVDPERQTLTLTERYRDGNVKQQFQMPLAEVPNMVEGVSSAFWHAMGHQGGHDHG